MLYFQLIKLLSACLSFIIQLEIRDKYNFSLNFMIYYNTTNTLILSLLHIYNKSLDFVVWRTCASLKLIKSILDEIMNSVFS